MRKSIFISTLSLILTFLHGTNEQNTSDGKMNMHAINDYMILENASRQSNGVPLTNDMYNKKEFSFTVKDRKQKRTKSTSQIESINNKIASFVVDEDEQSQIYIESEPNMNQRNLLTLGDDVKSVQAEDGMLWSISTYDYGGPDGIPDGYTELTIYQSEDNGETWDYFGYVYNSEADLFDPHIEVLHDRLLILYRMYNVTDGYEDLRVYRWDLDGNSNSGDLGLVIPEGFGSIRWGSITSDKFYYDIENTWVYVTYLVLNQETGESGIFYARSEDYGVTFDNLTGMWTEGDYTDNPSEFWVNYRIGIATTFSQDDNGPEHVLTTFSHSGNIYVSRIDIYDLTVTNTLTMASDDDQYFTASTMSANYGTIAVCAVRVPNDGTNADIGFSFSYDHGEFWGDDYSAWYYWDDPEAWDYSPTAHFSLDGDVFSFAYLKYRDGLVDINYRLNSSGDLLYNWDAERTVSNISTWLGDSPTIAIQDNTVLIMYSEYDDYEYNYQVKYFSEELYEINVITLTPDDGDEFTIGSSGGSFGYNAFLVNPTDETMNYTAYLWALMPNDNWYGPIAPTPTNVRLRPGSELSVNLAQNVPGGAPDGWYWYTAELYMDGDFATSDGFWFWKGDPEGIDSEPGDNQITARDHENTISVTGDSEWIAFYKEYGVQAKEGDIWTDEGLYHADGVEISAQQLGADDALALPDVYALHQNYPNPFNPSTNINYDIPELSDVSLEIYNVMGQKVRTLVQGSHQPGRYNVSWNATDEFGEKLSSGMYIYRIQAGDFVSIKKLVLMK